MKTYKDILKNSKILFIEDDPTILEYVSKTLKLICNNVYCSNNTREAKKIYDKKEINIIISDIKLPDGSGLDFVKNIRKTDKTTPIILLTAHSEKSFLLEAVKLNLIDYLIKPVNFTSLNNALKLASESLFSNSEVNLFFENGYSFNLNKKILLDDKNNIINLTFNELKLLCCFIEKKGHILTAEEIKYRVWGTTETSEGALKSLINKLRSKIGKITVKNHSGLGYQIIYKK